jgi:hypothetical protein
LHPKHFAPINAVLAKSFQSSSPEGSQPFKTAAIGLPVEASKASVGTAELSPELKQFIANAIVPVLIRRYIAEQTRSALSDAEVKG